MPVTDSDPLPNVLSADATGKLGGSIAAALARNYRIAGLDRDAQGVDFPVFEADFKSDASVELTLREFRDGNVCTTLGLSWRAQWARWLCAGIGALVTAAPFLFSTANAAAYLSDTLVGALIFALAVCTKPEPGPSTIAALTGPVVPPVLETTTHPTGRSACPSSRWRSWACTSHATWSATNWATSHGVGPIFRRSVTDPQNGTEEIITLVLPVVSIAAAEVARPVHLNVLLGAALMVTAFIWGADMVTTMVCLILGLALIGLSIRRGAIRERCGSCNRVIV